MRGLLTTAPGSVTSFVPLILRIGFAMCFVGHGVFGLLQKRDWLPFFSRFGIGEGWALSSMSRGTNTALRALMSGPVEPGSNRLLVTHQGLLYRSFSSLRQGSVAEGDCVVARPRDGEAEVLAVVKPAEWARLK